MESIVSAGLCSIFLVMRPLILNSYFKPLSSLPGIGARMEGLLSRLLGMRDKNERATLRDLLFHRPHGLVDRRLVPDLTGLAEGAIVTVKLSILDHQPPGGRGRSRAPYKVIAEDGCHTVTLVFFHAKSQWITSALPVGKDRYVSGKVNWFNGAPQIVHPDYIVGEDELDQLPLAEPIYPLTAGLSGKVVRKAIGHALNDTPSLPEWQDASILAREEWPSFHEALTFLHTPDSQLALDPNTLARERLAYDDYLASQLALQLLRASMRKLAGKTRTPTGRLTHLIRAAIPFSLTGSQEEALVEIGQDLQKPERMLRLLQGDVGAGKTLVALLALAMALEDGGQGALMAPTELLARQHLASIAPLAEAAGLRTAILTGREKGKERQALLNDLAQGGIDILIGTHAIFQDGVVFADLAMAVIDEQHRFGVHQRLNLSAKGHATDVLVMTATPIPRTLVLTCYGDMDVSRLLDKPAGRQPITTRVVSQDRLDELTQRIVAQVRQGGKAYWVCPLVEDSEEVDATSAEERHASLVKILGPQVGLVHGRMAAAEKDKVMAAFKAGDIRLLVSTTVIEVGVDVPDATIMIIENAERFGLAQLHQLRGRVGRGSLASSCILLYKPPLSKVGEARLGIMRDTEDGFLIAEEDLKLRGEGDILGTRQAGMPGFLMADAAAHAHLLETARKDAQLIVETDPGLTSTRGEALRILLYLFKRDEAIRLIRAG